MSTYDFSTLMAQTRNLAARYREATGQSLPVTVELARFDAVSLLGLTEIPSAESEAIREVAGKVERIQIKGRVIFPGGKSRQRVGQLNLKSPWDYTVLVIYNPEYQPMAIYQLSRSSIEQESDKLASNKRGSMTVAKFKAMGELLWKADSDSDPEPDKKKENGQLEAQVTVAPSKDRLNQGKHPSGVTKPRNNSKDTSSQ
jgi:hypothetical protein